MKISILTMCPEFFECFRESHLIKRSREKGLLQLEVIDFRDYAKKDHLILICGHYEGFDARIYPYADELLSVGDYIVSGGEIPAMAVADAVVRLLDGSLREGSADEESFEDGLLEYPQYTRPAVFGGQKVPEVLLSGDHEAIRRWRKEASLEMTEKYRPDLLCETNER